MGLTELIEKCISGDRVSQKVLFQSYNQLLYAVSRKYAYDVYSAEEVLQESWIEIFHSLKNYKDQGNFNGWLKTIVIRKAWKLNKRNMRHDNLDLEVVDESEYSSNMAVESMTCDELLSILNEVPNGPREVFKMYVLDGFKHEEIAQVLNMNASTSRSYLARARKFISNRFESNNKILSR